MYKIARISITLTLLLIVIASPNLTALAMKSSAVHAAQHQHAQHYCDVFGTYDPALFADIQSVMDEYHVGTLVQLYELTTDWQYVVLDQAAVVLEDHGGQFTQDLAQLLREKGRPFVYEAGRLTSTVGAQAVVDFGAILLRSGPVITRLLAGALEVSSDILGWLEDVSTGRVPIMPWIFRQVSTAADALAGFTRRYGDDVIRVLADFTQRHGRDAVIAFGNFLQNHSNAATRAANLLDAYGDEVIFAAAAMARYSSDVRFLTRRLARRGSESTMRQLLLFADQYGDEAYVRLVDCERILAAPPAPTATPFAIPDGVCPDANFVAFVKTDAPDPVLKDAPADSANDVGFPGFGTCYAVLAASDWGLQIQYGTEALWIAHINVFVESR